MPLPGDQPMHVQASTQAATACSGTGLPLSALSCAACSTPCMPLHAHTSLLVILRAHPQPFMPQRCCMRTPLLHAPSKSCLLSPPSELFPGNTPRRQHAALPSDCAACTGLNLQGGVQTALHIASFMHMHRERPSHSHGGHVVGQAVIIHAEAVRGHVVAQQVVKLLQDSSSSMQSGGSSNMQAAGSSREG